MYRTAHSDQDDPLRAALAAVAERDRLVRMRAAGDDVAARISEIDSRLTELGDVDAKLDAARRNKAAAMMASGSPAGQELIRIGEAIGTLDAEARTIDDAFGSGSAAVATLTRIAELLAAAGPIADLPAGMSSEAWAKSLVTRGGLVPIPGLAAQAHAQLDQFAPELSRYLDMFRDAGIEHRLGDARQLIEWIAHQADGRLRAMRRRRTEIDARRAERWAQVHRAVEAV